MIYDTTVLTNNYNDKTLSIQKESFDWKHRSICATIRRYYKWTLIHR